MEHKNWHGVKMTTTNEKKEEKKNQFTFSYSEFNVLIFLINLILIIFFIFIIHFNNDLLCKLSYTLVNLYLNMKW